uniref:Fab 14, heavy domain n=1 Tax=Mus musculus TaxID=10090 RepID=UPI0001A48ADF|nr:Chain H, Fab 14, heavy domain [Mus musculus]
AVHLQQSGTELVAPGGGVKLSCGASGYTFTNYDMNWVRQRPGAGLEWIGWIFPGDGSARGNEKFGGAAALAAAAAGGTAYMGLGGLSSEDSGVYFCARRGFAGAASFAYWGQGTLVTAGG